MRKKLLAYLLASAMLTGLMTGCGSSGAQGNKSNSEASASTSSTDGTSNSNHKKIEVVLKTLASEYWGFVQKGCEAAGKDLGVDVTVVGASSETSYDEQMNIIETAMGSGQYDALVIAPTQSDMVATKIANANLPIVAVDTNIKSPKVNSYVGFDNETAAGLGGEKAVALAKAAGWKDLKAIAIAGVQGDMTSDSRMKGYKTGVEKAGGTFLSNEMQYADGVADKAVTSMEAIMQNHPEGVAIIVCNNDDMAMAAARAAKDNAAYKNTVFVGFGGNESGLQSIIDGGMTFTVAVSGYDAGYKAVQAALDAANGKTLEKFIDSGCTVVDKDNVQDAMKTLKEKSK